MDGLIVMVWGVGFVIEDERLGVGDKTEKLRISERSSEKGSCNNAHCRTTFQDYHTQFDWVSSLYNQTKVFNTIDVSRKQKRETR